VAPWRLDAIGGVSVAVGMLYREMESQGHRVAALIQDENYTPHRIRDKPGYVVYGMYLRSPYIEIAPFRAWLAFLLCLPITLLRLHRLLTMNRIDVVHIHYPLPSMVYFGLLRRFARWRLVITYQGSDAHDLLAWRPLERRAVRSLLTAADQITGVSASLLEKVRAALPGINLGGVVVPNGAPVEEISSAAAAVQATLPDRYIVTVGLLIRRKGIDLLLDALAMLASMGETVALVVVGDGEERDSLENRAQEKGIAANILFVGKQSYEQTVALMKASAFFVLASHAEGLPLVIAEAMACGKTVVATAVDGVPEIVRHEHNGLMVPPGDPVALAQAIGRLWRDKAVRERLAQEAQKTAVENFSWQTIANRYTAIYKSNAA
jgi:glycosyltransferase involved in cell wall biosynthesis